MVAAPAAIVVPGAHAEVYMTLEQAQAQMFPGATFSPDFRTLTDAQADRIETLSGENVRNKDIKIWKVSTGGWFIVDEVVGKHEFIPTALALNADGTVKDIEILEYREAYGSQIRDPAWRAQFTGKRNGDTLTLTEDIKNISGATLSSRHITGGVKRLLATYATVIVHG
jgi:Na+-transporting NADH:ubiquinone oxidoreductase subunit NqrC